MDPFNSREGSSREHVRSVCVPKADNATASGVTVVSPNVILNTQSPASLQITHEPSLPGTGAPVFNSNPFAHGSVSNTTGFSKAPTSHTSEAIEHQDVAIPSRVQSLHEFIPEDEPPKKKGSRAYRWLRWGFGSVYRRIFCCGFIANSVVLLFLALRSLTGGPALSADEAITAVSANLLAAMLVRNEHFVNLIFTVFGTWPKKLPLRLRCIFAKVYSYGGIHSGGGAAATAWFVAFLVLATKDFIETHEHVMAKHVSYLSLGTLLATYLVLIFLVLILVFAHPTMRVRYHDSFERTHRFLGWGIVVLFWLLAGFAASLEAAKSTNPNMTTGKALSENPGFWMLLCITALVVYPWLRLRKHDVEATKLSNHALLLRFTYRNAHYGQAIRLTDSPLMETHAFATIPNPPVEHFAKKQRTHSQEFSYDGFSPVCTPKPEEGKQLGFTSSTSTDIPFAPPGKKGFSVIISSAGDWTRKMIAHPPMEIKIRGVPQYGVLRVAGMFEPVIIVATGSGIAPCLSLFVEKPDHPVKIVWSTKDPIKTYGHAVLSAVKKADPDAVIWDTSKSGRPDLVRMVHGIWEASKRGGAMRGAVDGIGRDAWEMEEGNALKRGESRDERNRRLRRSRPCEAVVIISNQNVTRKVVYGLESRGVPSYGAIFDS